MAKLNISSWFNNKKFTVVLSVVLAVILWFAITIVENPESERVINGVPVYLETAGTIVDEQGLSIISDTKSLGNVSVRISGRTSVVNSITPDDLLVKPTLDGVNAAGKYTLKLEASNNTTKNFNVESVSPETIDVEFDYIDTISYDVNIKIRNAVAADGLTLGTARFTNTEKMMLEISGPRSIVSKISSVVAVAKADKSKKLTATESYEASIHLYDDKSKEISKDGLSLGFDSISVSLPVLKSKMVPIRCTYINKPNDYTPTATVIIDDKEISKIEIEGSPDIIDKTSFIELEAIDFLSVSKSNNQFEKNIVLPSGVSLVADDVKTASVKLATSFLKTKSFKISEARAINNNNSYSVKLTNPITVKVCGEASVIDSISSNNLYAQLDLDGKELGEQTMPITVKSNAKDNVWQIGTYDAKVTVYK